MFRIEIIAQGGHGCQREKGDGEKVFGCNRIGCPDCETRRLVRLLRENCEIDAAVLTHFAGDEEHEVKDDLLSFRRSGNFAP